MPKSSLIGSIYNVDPYLARRIESIQKQIFTDLKMILVDDGSSDPCGKICDEFAIYHLLDDCHTIATADEALYYYF